MRMTSRAARGRLVALACCALAVSPAPALEACATQHHGAIANFSVQLLHARLSSNVPKLGEEINFWAENYRRIYESNPGSAHSTPARLPSVPLLGARFNNPGTSQHGTQCALRRSGMVA